MFQNYIINDVCIHILYQYLDYQWFIENNRLYYICTNTLPERFKVTVKKFPKSVKIKLSNFDKPVRILSFTTPKIKNITKYIFRAYSYNKFCKLDGIQYIYTNKDYILYTYVNGIKHGPTICSNKDQHKYCGNFKYSRYYICTYTQGFSFKQDYYTDESFKKICLTVIFKDKQCSEALVTRYYPNGNISITNEMSHLYDNNGWGKWYKHGSECIYREDKVLILNNIL
jgi:hypothetical protein